MFTGIIELLGEIKGVQEEGTNRIFRIAAPFPEAIKVDQSIAHNGACLTVTEIYAVEDQTEYSVTAVEETLDKTELGQWKVGKKVNIERCMQIGARLDGHFVQGHVDTVGRVERVEEREGSWIFEFSYPDSFEDLLVDKGSVCVNGVSLTVISAASGRFTVTIIPYTFEHTSFHALAAGDSVNLEFDILGKYMYKMLKGRGVL